MQIFPDLFCTIVIETLTHSASFFRFAAHARALLERDGGTIQCLSLKRMAASSCCSRSGSGGGGRCVIHVDLDCFYVQVEIRDNPSLKNRPVAVVQYNQWQGGGIIALSYEAKAAGVKRSMRGEEAKKNAQISC